MEKEIETEVVTDIKRCQETESFLKLLGFEEKKQGWWTTTLSKGLYMSITYNSEELFSVYCRGKKTGHSFNLIDRYQLQTNETVKQILLRLVDFQVFCGLAKS